MVREVIPSVNTSGPPEVQPGLFHVSGVWSRDPQCALRGPCAGSSISVLGAPEPGAAVHVVLACHCLIYLNKVASLSPFCQGFKVDLF